MFSRSLRADWAQHGVGVSAVCPGVINTPIIEASRFLGTMGSPQALRMAQRTFGRGHRPEVVAVAVMPAIAPARPVVPPRTQARPTAERPVGNAGGRTGRSRLSPHS